ncbi:energy transducer TonB [Chitiniphilus eburneus]|uniref:Uncharacterized protein n=1 Tax=Chitiniphilus eburneus TaxID=2571148 RepID=A0A4U0Q8A8_9NEIS|nr:hypothetical protein [Chitiniphilus eburneus]TJZ77503.1 hypothetical protein FAZ21_03990 [Chitiniphilus eburneus]
MILLFLLLQPSVLWPVFHETPLEIHLVSKAKPGLQKKASDVPDVVPMATSAAKQSTQMIHSLVASHLPAWQEEIPAWLTASEATPALHTFMEAEAIVEPDFQLPPRDAEMPPLIELDVGISDRGEVEDVTVVSSVLDPRQTAAIVRQLYRTLFTPAKEDGKPVPSIKRVTDSPR